MSISSVKTEPATASDVIADYVDRAKQLHQELREKFPSREVRCEVGLDYNNSPKVTIETKPPWTSENDPPKHLATAVLVAAGLSMITIAGSYAYFVFKKKPDTTK